jgi:hypothetical protein
VFNPFQRPIGFVSQQPLRHFRWMLQVNTSVAKGSLVGGEHISAFGRVVHVHVMLVGEDDLEQAQGVVRSWSFPDRQLPGT